VECLDPFRAMSDREIPARKMLYRAAGFKGRDLFDFITVTEAVPDLPDDPDLHGFSARIGNALAYSMDTPALVEQVAKIEENKENFESNGAAGPAAADDHGEPGDMSTARTSVVIRRRMSREGKCRACRK